MAYRRWPSGWPFQGQWEKAGDRFAKLIEIDELDHWDVVSWTTNTRDGPSGKR